MRGPWREALSLTPNEAARHGLALGKRRATPLGVRAPVLSDIGLADLRASGRAFGGLDRKIAEQLEIDAKYAVYLDPASG